MIHYIYTQSVTHSHTSDDKMQVIPSFLLIPSSRLPPSLNDHNDEDDQKWNLIGFLIVYIFVYYDCD